MNLTIFKAVIMSLIPWYRVDLHLTNYPADFTYVAYESGAKISSQKLTSSNEAYFKLKTLLAKEKNGWKYDNVSYAPGRVFDAREFNVNCRKNGMIVIVYRDSAGDMVQVSKIVNERCPTPSTSSDMK